MDESSTQISKNQNLIFVKPPSESEGEKFVASIKSEVQIDESLINPICFKMLDSIEFSRDGTGYLSVSGK